MLISVTFGKEVKLKVKEGENLESLLSRIGQKVGHEVSFESIVLESGYAKYNDSEKEVVDIPDEEIIKIPKLKSLVKQKLEIKRTPTKMEFVSGK